MLLDDLDWFDVYRRLDVWQALTPASREAYAALRPSDSVRASTFGDDLPALVDAGFLVDPTGINVRVHPDAKPLVRAFRLMVRHPFLTRHEPTSLVSYITELLTRSEQAEFAAVVGRRYWSHEALAEHVSSVDWPRRFAAPQEEDDRLPDRALPAARRLVADLLETPGPMRLRDLPQRLEAFDAEAQWEAVNLAIANLAVFPVFLDGDEPLAEPGLILWPPTARRHFAPPPQAPSERAPEESWRGPILVQDASAMLVVAATEPLRLRQNDGAFYVRTAEDLAATLAPLPDWLTGSVRGLDVDARLGRARRLLQDTALLEVRHLTGGRFGLAPADRAEEWVALGPPRQLRSILDWWRVGEGFVVWGPGGEAARAAAAGAAGTGPQDGLDAHADDEWDDESDDDYGDFDYGDFDPDGLEFDEGDIDDPGFQLAAVRPPVAGRFDYSSFPGYTGRLRGSAADLARAIRDAVERIDGCGFVGLEDFVRYEAEVHNPLESDIHDLRLGWGWGRQPAEALRYAWADELRAFVLNRLVMAGGARIGIDEEGLLVFEPTSVGRYLVGLTGSFELELPDEAGTVVVQPDFEVVFLAPAPETETAVSRFAERLGHGVGRLFRLTPEAAFAAAAAGLSADAVLETLEAAAAQPIPSNVEHELRAWFGRARRLYVRRTLVVECEDPEVARRLSAAGGSDVRLLGETVVEIPGGKLGRRLLKRAAARGLFLSPPEEE